MDYRGREPLDGRIEDLNTAHELAMVESELRPDRVLPPGFIGTVLHPLGRIGQWAAKRSVTEVYPQIEYAQQVQDNGLVKRFYQEAARNASQHDLDEGVVLDLARMPGHERYKYQPQSVEETAVYALANAIHEGASTPQPLLDMPQLGRWDSETTEAIGVIHTLCGTDSVRRYAEVPLALSYEQDISVQTGLGFRIREAYVPDKPTLPPMAYMLLGMMHYSHGYVEVSLEFDLPS